MYEVCARAVQRLALAAASFPVARRRQVFPNISRRQFRAGRHAASSRHSMDGKRALVLQIATIVILFQSQHTTTWAKQLGKSNCIIILFVELNLLNLTRWRNNLLSSVLGCNYKRAAIQRGTNYVSKWNFRQIIKSSQYTHKNNTRRVRSKIETVRSSPLISRLTLIRRLASTLHRSSACAACRRRRETTVSTS